MITLGATEAPAFFNEKPGRFAGSGKPELADQPGGTTEKAKEWVTRRGSWVRKDGIVDGDVVLCKDGSGCNIIVGSKEHPAVKQAANFLSGDISRISGWQPKIKSSSDGNSQYADIYLHTLGSEEVLPDEINTDDLTGKWEAFKIVTFNNSVWLIGADFRGTAFAVYTLCERLGVDPLHVYTGYEPQKHTTLVLKKTDYEASSPTFKYRGFFHDDEDILPRPFDYNGYPLQIGDIDMVWYKRYFETALRLRLNMVAPYTRVHRRYEVQQCASDWGLIYTSHHYDILLSNPLGLKIFNLAEKRNVDPDWNWFKNKEGMRKYWRAGVWENKDLNCIWPVGLRGTGDLAYPFPKGTTDDEQAKVYHDVIVAQTDIAKKIMPRDQPPVYTLTLYNEMLNKYEKDKDVFDVPEDVIIVWPDDYLGKMRKLPDELGKWKHGVYYHLAVAGFELTMQSANMVSPVTIADQFGKIIDAGATEYMLVNVSQLREYTMGARLIAEICWDAPSVLNNEEPGEAYIDWWCNEYFGPDGNKEAAKIYEPYYKLLYVPNILWFASNIVWQLLDCLVKKIAGESFEPVKKEDIQLLDTRKKEYEKAMDIFSRASKNMSPEQQQYFFETTMIGLCFDWRPTQAAFLLLKALEAKDEKTMWNYVHQSFKPLEQLELEILRAERPPFDKWYRATWLRPKLTGRNVHRSYNAVRAFISSQGRNYIPFDDIKEYYKPGEYEAWNKFLDKSEKIRTPLS